MEIVAEILFTIFGGVIEFLFSIVFQIVAEIVGGIFGAVRDSGRQNRSLAVKRWAAVATYIMGGLAAGLLSLWLAPTLWLEHSWQRAINLLFMPAVVGLLMQLWDNWRARSARPDPSLPGFARGYLFAICMATVRLAWGK